MNNKEKIHSEGISITRRSLVKGSALGGLALASGALNLPFMRNVQAAPVATPPPDKVTWGMCSVTLRVTSAYPR